MNRAIRIKGGSLLPFLFFLFSEVALEAQVQCPADITVYQTDPPFEFTGAFPEGGTYSGNGVIGPGLFDPMLAGPGAQVITYTVLALPEEWVSCDFLVTVLPSPQSGSSGSGLLRIGREMNPEPWNNWLDAGQPAGSAWVRGMNKFTSDLVSGFIFEFSEDSINWIPFAADADGGNLLVPGPVQNGPATTFQGWSGLWPFGGLAGSSVVACYLRAVITYNDGTTDTIYRPSAVRLDPTPLNSVELSIPDFHAITGETLEIGILPGNSNLSLVYGYSDEKFIYYESGVTAEPGPVQHALAGAAAAVIADLALPDFPALMGGLAQGQLADSLAVLMGADSFQGASPDNLAAALYQWSESHGGGLLFAGDRLEVYFDPAYSFSDFPPSTSWTTDHWYSIRDGFENGQGLLLTASWPENGQVHSLAFSCIAALNIVILGSQQLMLGDPVSGIPLWADLDANTGILSNFRDTLSNPLPGYPSQAWITSWMLIRLKQQEPSNGYPLLASGPGPHTLSFSLPDPGLYWIRLVVVDEDGHARAIHRVVRRIPEIQGGVGLTLHAGKFLHHPFSYENYLDGRDSTLRLWLTGSMPGDTADWVDFYVSQDSLNWVLVGSDDNGDSRPAPGPAGNGEKDGWTAWVPHTSLPLPSAQLFFRAEVTLNSGQSVTVPLACTIAGINDPPTVSIVQTSGLDIDPVTGMYRNTGGSFSFDVDPGLANILEIAYSVTAKVDSFAKGVPGVIQPGPMDCGPTALAACLGWFHQQGDGTVTGGKTLDELIDTLKIICKTDSAAGTYDDDLADGISRWLKDHGSGYSVRHIPYERVNADGTASRTWTEDDFETMRDELEHGQDVITFFTWKDADGNETGHYMTMNSLVNKKQANGKYRVDYMDPSSGDIIYGDVDPLTGAVTGYVQADGTTYPPDSAMIFSNIIICPADTNPIAAGMVLIPGPDPGPVQISLPSPGQYWLNISILHTDGYLHREYYPIEYTPVYPCPASLKVTGGSDPFPLASPGAVGVFSGTGIFNNVFSPFLAGDGVHPFIFTYPAPDGQLITCQGQIEVVPDDTLPLCLAVGNYLDPESMHDWVPAGEGPLTFSLYGIHEDDSVDKVGFSAIQFFDPGSEPFLPYPWYPPLAVDSGGTALGAKGPLNLTRGLDGWTGYIPQEQLPEVTEVMQMLAVASVCREQDTVLVFSSFRLDPSPPHSLNLSIPDWHITQEPVLTLFVDPVLANLSEIYCGVVTKLDSFAKGIPTVMQSGDNDCGPTSLTACFKWFAAKGDPTIVGDLTNQQMADSLRNLSGAGADEPLAGDQLADAAGKWLAKHGTGYEVRRVSYNRIDADGSEEYVFNEEAWKKMRNELEKGQNVITLFNWVDGEDTLGHFMTFNSIVNTIQENGKYRVDYMDPATGQIIYGDLDPVTGQISDFKDSDGVTYPPDGSLVSENIIICPKTPPQGGGTSTRGPMAFSYIPDSFLIPLPDPGLYWIHLKVWDMDGHYTEIDRVVKRLGADQTIQGVVSYDNPGGTLLDSVTVVLLSGNDTVAVTLTDSLGNYQFSGLAPGTYQLAGTSAKAWGGTNTIDALLILKHAVDLDTLSGLRLAAADVNATGYINANDGLQVARRFTEIIDQFEGSDWIFGDAEVEVTAGEPAVTVLMQGICRGDVNASFIPW